MLCRPTPNTNLCALYHCYRNALPHRRRVHQGLEGVEFDTLHYGSPPAGGVVNYGRVLGAEAIMHEHGLRSGVFLNAFHDRRAQPDCPALPVLGPGGCSASAASRTINYTGGYMALPGRMSEHVVLEQWQPYPSITGPEDVANTGMWMALQCAEAVKKYGV